MINVAVAGKDLRLLSRVLRQNTLVRRQMTASALATVVQKSLSVEQQSYFRKFLFENGDVMEVEKTAEKKGPEVITAHAALPEVCAYLQLLCVVMLIDTKRYDEAVEASAALLAYVLQHKSRTMDDIGSRAYFFFSRAHELTNNFAGIRPTLLGAYRTAVLRHDHVGQAMLLNLLLRNYIHFNLYDQADKLVRLLLKPQALGARWGRG